MKAAAQGQILFTFLTSFLLALSAFLIARAICLSEGAKPPVYDSVRCFVFCLVIYWPCTRHWFLRALGRRVVVWLLLGLAVVWLGLSDYPPIGRGILGANILLVLLYYFGISSRRSLRRQPLLKNLCIAFCWTTGPAALLHASFTQWYLWWPPLFLLLLGLSLQSDRVDINEDRKLKLPTLISGIPTSGQIPIILIFLLPGMLLLQTFVQQPAHYELLFYLFLLLPVFIDRCKGQVLTFLHKESGILLVALYIFLSSAG